MPNIIHETILKDILDLVGDTKDLLGNREKMIDNYDKRKVNKFTSLTRNANKLILVFPVLCTKGISIETASMLSKAIEKNCVNLLQMLFASVQITSTTDLDDYISRFHSNISLGDKITVDDFISVTDMIVQHASGESGMIEITDRVIFEQFKENMKDFNNFIKTTVNENSLSDFKCYRNYNGFETVLEVRDQKIDNPRSEQEKLRFIDKLSDNDIKKANELMPTKVIVDYNVFDDKTQTVTKVERAIIGVKCKLYSVDSLELIERVATKYADSNWVRELVRASTGEISFWRDFVFALDRARVDSINSAKQGSSAKMWKVLERRATKNRLGRWKANKADSAPITT